MGTTTMTTDLLLVRLRLACGHGVSDVKNARFASALLAALLLLAGAAGAHARGGEEWFSAWSVSHGLRLTTPAVSGTTVRMIVRPTISGNQLRVKLENTMGMSPVAFSAAYVGVRGEGAAVLAGSNRQLSFGGNPGLTLAAGAGAYSDPIKFHVQAFRELAVSLEVVSAADISAHQVGLTTNYIAAGARAASASADGFAPVPEFAPANSGNLPFYWVATVDVRSPSTTGAIVLFGDSITDGRCSTRDEQGIVQPNRYQRWGDVLAARIAALPENQSKGISNQGIAGNRILDRGNGPSALERIERDVLERAGATHVVLFEGTNDITGGFTADQVIAGTQEIIQRVHDAGMKIIGVTVIPRGRIGAGWSATLEQHRLAVNAWMRSEAKFDGLIDFDRLLEGPVLDGSPSIKPEFNCDFTHPNAAGYRAMGEFIDLNLFYNVGTWRNGK